MSENPDYGLPTGKATDADTNVSAPPCLRVSLMLGMKNFASGNPTCDRYHHISTRSFFTSVAFMMGEVAKVLG